MAFDFSGSVIRGARTANANATTTGRAQSGVVRDVKPLPPTFDLTSSNGYAPDLVDADADHYRTAILNSPVEGTTEYMIWAANSSQIARIDTSNDDWLSEDGTGTIPIGTDPVQKIPASAGYFEDGTNKVIVTDNGGNSIAAIKEIRVRNGGTLAVTTIDAVDFKSVDPDSGLIEVSSPVLVADFNGAFSNERGDRVTKVEYWVAASRFWWTRNDPYETRFGWDAGRQQWRPYKGGPVKDLGPLSFDGTYVLSPRPTGVGVGDYLPGTAGNGDRYAMVRLGRVPDSGSLPVAENNDVLVAPFSGLLVVDDGDVGSYSFSSSGAPEAGVVGLTSGAVQWNPSFIQEYAGQMVWYSHRSFDAEATGGVGALRDADRNPLFITPPPTIGQHVFIRVGTRRFLTPILVESDTDLDTVTPSVTEVGVSMSTGKLKLSEDLVGKADPDNPLYDPQYLGAQVNFDGVALNEQPQPLRQPVPLEDEDGDPIVGIRDEDKAFVPVADPFEANGLGTSGILHVPDWTGAEPRIATSVPGVRPGGNNSVDQTTGLVRHVYFYPPGVESVYVGDTFMFSYKGAVEFLLTVPRTEDLPGLSLGVKGGKAKVAREATLLTNLTLGSAVKLNFKAIRDLGTNNEVYFQQAWFRPATYTNTARVVGRIRDEFTFDGGETLVFAIDGVLPAHEWTATAGTFSIDEVVADIQANTVPVLPANAVSQSGGHLVLQAATSIEIGFGKNNVKDLSACEALGVLPGWRAVGGQDNWLSDSGLTFGLNRSPLNLDRSEPYADFQERYRVEDLQLSPDSGIQAQALVLLDYPPLQDVPGYDDNVFFQITTLVQNGPTVAIDNRYLYNPTDVLYRFGEGYFAWLDESNTIQAIEQPRRDLTLGQVNVIEDSLLGAQPDPDMGLFVSEGGSFQRLTTDQYTLINGGVPGIALLTEQVGGLVASGSRGSWGAGSNVFINDFQGDENFENLGIEPGYRLKIPSGDATGSYIVQQVVSPTTLIVSPPFLWGSGERFASWDLYKGFTDEVYDPAIVADVLFEEFNHLPEEPFHIRVLSPLGETPADPAAQTANRLQAVMTDALQSGREISLRFGIEHATATNTASLTGLGRKELGTIANDSLFLPGATESDPEHTRYEDQAFFIQLGTEVFTPGSGLTAVTQFTDPFPPGAIEYLISTGELRFGSEVLSDYDQAEVLWVASFLDAAKLVEGVAEYDPATGLLNLSEADLIAHTGQEVYFVEQMVTEARKDVAFSPLASAFAFMRPLRERQVVEVDFFKADLTGHKAKDGDGNDIEVLTYLPVYINGEMATRVESKVYSFNPPDGSGFRRTVFTEVEPTIWVNGYMQNFGVDDLTIDYEDFTIHFKTDLQTTDEVRVSYAVINAFGGEKAYSSAVFPAYRPPFFLEANQDTFLLDTDRRGDMEPGRMMRLGAFPTYIKSSTYDSSADQTTVTIFPAPVVEAGSRAPGNDVLTLITDIPVTTEVDPDNPVAIPDAPAGFLLPLSDATLGGDLDWEPVNRGGFSIDFQGNLMKFAVAGHLMEVGGYPFIIADASISEDGFKTTVTFTSPFPQGFSMENGDAIKLSVRPMYPPQPRNFLGVSPFLATEGTELVLFGETDEDGNELPGRTLVPSVEYVADADTGNISLLEPIQAPLAPVQKLYFRYTKVGLLQPEYDKGTLRIPRYTARYRFNTVPSEENGLLGGLLQATYSFYNPDSFFARVVPLQEYAFEAATEIIGDVTSGQGGQGPLLTSGASTPPDAGLASLTTERGDLTDLDRAARLFLSFYNDAVVAFEQIKEAIDGSIVGDRDGKFRFYIGKGKDYVPPGYEDAISGLLNPRFIWSEVMQSSNVGFEMPVLETDPLLDPLTAVILDAVMEGVPMDPFTLGRLFEYQKRLIQNDIDDRLLTGPARPKLDWNPALGPVFQPFGTFESMWEPQPFSRLFPERTNAFFLTYPGINADPSSRTLGVDRSAWAGRYSFLTPISRPSFSWEEGYTPPQFASTYRTDIASISNPVIGPITQIRNILVQRRLARGRVWRYFPTGIEAEALFPGSPAVTDPCAIVSLLPLSEFPIDPGTGFPDTDRFIAQGGDLYDLTTGDPELRTPAWSDFPDNQQLQVGQPTGVTYPIAYKSGSMPVGDGLPGIYVNEVLYGCIVTFKSLASGGPGAPPTDVPISDSTEILRLTDINSGPVMSLEQGDTLYVIPPAFTPAETDSPPTEEDELRMRLGMPQYRRGMDVAIRNKLGVLRDLSLPGGADNIPFDLQKFFGQNPPLPMSELQALCNFTNESIDPLQLPCLLGEAKDDTGDFQIPYVAVTNTEIDRLSAITVGISDLLTIKSADGTQYVYPDEVRGSDGLIQDALGGVPPLPPATLITTSRHDPATFNPAALGVGDVEQYDLLLMEYGSPTILPTGSQGFLSVGRVQRDATDSYSLVEVPRFITQTAQGDPIQYDFNNALTYFTPNPQPPPPLGIGCRIYEDTTTQETWLDFSDLGQIRLNDGGGVAGIGGLNRIFAADPGNAVIIRLFAREPFVGPITVEPGDIVLTIILFQGQIRAVYADGSTNTVPGTTVSAGENNPNSADLDFRSFKYDGYAPGNEPIDLSTHPEIPSTNAAGIWSTDYGYDFTISVTTLGGGTAFSDTAYIDSDRLTFIEVVDCRTALPRGTRHPVGFQEIGCNLVVHGVTVEGAGSLSDVNKWVNGDSSGIGVGLPFPLTFLQRDPSQLELWLQGTTEGIGVWEDATVSGAGDERGAVRVMSFEGYEAPTADTATASPTLVGGQITAIAVTYGGSGYDRGIARVFITDPTGISAEAEAVVTAGVVTAVNVLNPGHAYTAPVVTIVHEAGNISCLDSNLRFSLIPSSEKDETELVVGDLGTICTGVSLIRDGESNRFSNIDTSGGLPYGGAITKVVAGDVIEVRTGSSVTGTIKAGTYLVRHGVQDNTPIHAPGPLLGGDRLRALTLSTTAGGRNDWADIAFPQIANAEVGNPSIDEGARQIRVTDLFEEELTGLSPTNHAFPAAPGRLYCITTLDGVDSEVVSAEYTSIDTVNLRFTLAVNTGAGEYRRADGTTIPAGSEGTDFWDLLSDGMTVSGMVYFALRINGDQNSSLPANNAVGFRDDITGTQVSAHGFAGVTVTTPAGATNPSELQEFVYDSAYYGGAATVYDIEESSGAPTPEALQVHAGTVNSSDVFVPDVEDAVFDHVPVLLDLSAWATVYGVANVWTTIRQWAQGATCLLPGDNVSTSATFTALAPTNVYDDVDTNGLWMAAGIWTEPSFPLPALNKAELDNLPIGAQRLVDRLTDPVDLAALGFRFGGYDEIVEIQVRRIRRFHDILEEVGDNFTPLRYAYEIRRGKTTGYSQTDKQIGLVEAQNFAWPPDGSTGNNGTQMGPFTSPDVGINNGDVFRLLDNGDLVDEVVIQGVTNDHTLALAPPGITYADFLASPGDARFTFEIYIKQAPVPHEQSNAQLLDLMTDQVVTETVPDYATQTGGYVPAIPYVPPTGNGFWEDYANLLYDDRDLTPFTERGVQEGDIVLVDPAGEVRGPGAATSPPEEGVRPFGDDGIIDRPGVGVTGTSIYTAGLTDTLDDNRGFYRVEEVLTDHLRVSAGYTGDFEGNLTSQGSEYREDVKFPNNPAYLSDLGYTVYPTIHASVINQPPFTETSVDDGQEGQMDLRPTQYAGIDNDGTPVPGFSDSFAVNDFSIRPFGFKVIRPSTLFSDEAIEFVLMNRERTLSLIEQFRQPLLGGKEGSYFVFQRDLHGRNLGVPTLPQSGLGVYHNALLYDLTGRVDVVPYSNDTDCLGVTDRRFWIKDSNLDSLTAAASGVGMRKTGVGDVPYTAYTDTTGLMPGPSIGSSVRPVLPDYVDIALDIRDRFRDLRFAWVRYRAHRTEGTLAQIRVFDAELPKRLEEREEILLQQKANT